jgi:hypothetical protein
VKINEKCHFLHNLFNTLQEHKFNEVEINMFQFTGVYIVFEKGEFAHDNNRIVRIGTTTGENTVLADRLHEHYENEGRSVFRNHIAVCLLKKNGDPLELSGLFYRSKNEKYCIKSKIEREKWKKNVANQAELLEYKNINEKISSHIRKNCSFAVFSANRENCEKWEKKIISTISTCTTCKQSDNWLGNYIPNERKKICEGGLWNITHVNNKNILTDTELYELERIVKLYKMK